MNLLLVEDHLAFRQSLRIALDVDPERRFTVVGEVDSAREAWELIERLKPDVVLADMMLKDTDGVALLRELGRRGVRARVLMLARMSHPAFVQEAFQAGATGYSLKDDPLQEIITAIERVARGEVYVSPRVNITPAGPESTSPASVLGRLSAREREVFSRLIEGMSAKEIATALCISVRTVHSHRLRINRVLGVR